MYDHTNYFRSLAASLKPTEGPGHFYGTTEAHGGLTIFENLRELASPCIVADDEPAIRWVDSGGDGLPELLLFDREGRFVGRMSDIHQLRNELAH